MKSIIFDMDGTLINSGNIIANTINHVRINCGLDKMDKNVLLENINNPDINSAEFFYGTKNFTPKHSKLFETYYKKHCISDIILYDGIKELLEKLKDDFFLCIATNASSSFAIEMTQHLKIKHYFKDIIGANDVKNPKPDPEMLNVLISRNNLIKTQTILIGDGPKDILSANSIKLDSLLVNWGFSTHQDDAIQDIKQLEDEIFNWNSK